MAFFGWIPGNRWIFHHSSSFLMTLGPSSSAFVSFLSYRWLFNVATSFVNGPLGVRVWKVFWPIWLFKVGTLANKIWTICQIFHFVWKTETVQKGNLYYYYHPNQKHGNGQKNVYSVTWDGFSYSRHVRYLLFPLVVLVRGGVGWGCVSTIHHVSVSPSLRTHTLLVRG